MDLCEYPITLLQFYMYWSRLLLWILLALRVVGILVSSQILLQSDVSNLFCCFLDGYIEHGHLGRHVNRLQVDLFFIHPITHNQTEKYTQLAYITAFASA